MNELRWIMGRSLMWFGRSIIPSQDRSRLIASDFAVDLDAEWLLSARSSSREDAEESA
jgi:hypothetical protein